MTALKLLVLVACLLLCLDMVKSRASADDVKTGFSDRVHKDAEGKEHRYVLFVPHDYKPDKSWPLILFLHGAGESGEDGKKPAAVGLGPAIKKREKTFPFIAIFPQATRPMRGVGRNWFAESDNGKRALAILDEVEKKVKVDAKRVYLTGLSMGGYGTWNMAAKHPERWAAIAPVCGGGDPKDADKIKDLPCWCFHGGDDKVVPAKQSRDMVAALWAAGGHPNYTEYPGIGHNSWDKAYDTPDLYEWFLKHYRK